MTILVTGGTGFIGREVARQLVARAEDVVLFDIALRRELLEDIAENVKFVRGDLANWSSVLNAVKEHEPDSIIHLGSMLSASCEMDPWSAYRVNCDGMFHTLEAARLF